MTHVYRTDLIRRSGSPKVAGEDMTEIAERGWRLHTLVQWSENYYLAIFEKEITSGQVGSTEVSFDN